MRIGTQELIIILIVVIIIFGPTQIPKLTKMFGKSVKSFKAGMEAEETEEDVPAEKIVERFKKSVNSEIMRQEALIDYDIDEYDERFLRHLALGYTKEQITNLRGMPFGVKSLEKRQNELVQKLFPDGNGKIGVNATRLVVRACELHILDIDNLRPDEE